MNLELDFSLLRRVMLSDAELFAGIAAENISDSCEWSFCNLLWWGAVNRIMFLPCNGRLIIYDPVNRCNYFPVGREFSGGELLTLLRQFRDRGLSDAGDIYDLPEDYYFRHPELHSQITAAFDPGESDYIYDLDHLRELSGSKLRKKRNLIRQFQRENPGYFIRRITPENIGEAVMLAEKLNSKLHSCPFLEMENKVMESCRSNFAGVGADGIILYANADTAAGFSIFSPVNRECVDIHFEKADHEVTGASQMLTWAVADYLKDTSFKRMNREQDMGEYGLRRAKTSLDPLYKFRRMTAKINR